MIDVIFKIEGVGWAATGHCCDVAPRLLADGVHQQAYFFSFVVLLAWVIEKRYI